MRTMEQVRINRKQSDLLGSRCDLFVRVCQSNSRSIWASRRGYGVPGPRGGDVGFHCEPLRPPCPGYWVHVGVSRFCSCKKLLERNACRLIQGLFSPDCKAACDSLLWGNNLSHRK